MTYDSVLVFAKSWGALYILVFFLASVVWAFWPSKKREFQEAARRPLDEDDTPWR